MPIQPTPDQIAALQSAISKLVSDQTAEDAAIAQRQTDSAAADAANEKFHTSQQLELSSRATVRLDVVSVLNVAGAIAGVTIVVGDDDTVTVTPKT